MRATLRELASLRALAFSFAWGLLAPQASAQVDGVVVVEEASETPSGPVEAPKRAVEGREVFLRPNAEAFVDPDQRLNLEPKYYFLLAEESANAGFAKAAADHRPAGRWQLDYRSADPRPESALLLEQDHEGRLRVLRTGPPAQAVKTLAERKPDADAKFHGDPACDALDRPQRGEPGAGLLGRTIAVLRAHGDRYAIDFHNESLTPEADRRLWLPQSIAAGGSPRGLCFTEIDVQAATGAKRVAVISVLYADRWIGFDFPLARSPALENLRKMALRAAESKNPAAAPSLDASKLLGEEVIDELSRRLVDAAEK